MSDIMVMMGVQILVKSSFQFLAICLIVKDCTPAFIRRQALMFWTSTMGNKLEFSLLRYTVLEAILRILQVIASRTNWTRFCDIFIRICCNIFLLLTIAELIYHAFEFQLVRSGVTLDKQRQLVSFAVFVLVFGITILIRLVVRRCVDVLEVVIFGF